MNHEVMEHGIVTCHRPVNKKSCLKTRVGMSWRYNIYIYISNGKTLAKHGEYWIFFWWKTHDTSSFSAAPVFLCMLRTHCCEDLNFWGTDSDIVDFRMFMILIPTDLDVMHHLQKKCNDSRIYMHLSPPPMTIIPTIRHLHHQTIPNILH